MKNRLFRKYCYQSITLIILLLFFLTSDVFAKTIAIDSSMGSKKIALELKLANDGDTLLFEAGEYTLNLFIDKAIILQGESTADTILKGDGVNSTIDVNANASVTIQNFSFIDSEIAIFVSAASNLTITNNIFRPKSTNVITSNGIGTAISAVNNSGVTIENNVFYKTNTVIAGDDRFSKVVRNNIFFKNTVLNTGIVNSDFSFNCFDDSEEGYDNINSNVVVKADDIGLVDEKLFDFHLQNDSSCKDAGEDISDLDETLLDLGAYGGQKADQVAFPIQKITIVNDTTATTSSAIIKWDKNLDHRLTGYKIYSSQNKLESDNRSDLIPGTTANDVLTFQLDNLIEAGEESKPTAPLKPIVIPNQSKLDISWQAVEGANQYTLHYRAENGAEETPIELEDVTTYELGNLSNGVNYTIWLTANFQSIYYIQVVGYIDYTDPENANDLLTVEGLFIKDDIEYKSGNAIVSEASEMVLGMPEAIKPYPILPNEGCFIATAAFGYYSADQVQLLRNFRDEYLLTNQYGQSFVEWYYHYGPYAADYINMNEIFKPVVRVMLFPLISFAWALNYGVSAFAFLMIAYLLAGIILIRFFYMVFQSLRLN